MRSGIPATALRASMAIPGVFTPVLKQGMTLVDGGLSNNYPVDVARRMGADIVIGSTVQKEFVFQVVHFIHARQDVAIIVARSLDADFSAEIAQTQMGEAHADGVAVG